MIYYREHFSKCNKEFAWEWPEFAISLRWEGKVEAGKSNQEKKEKK